MIRPSKEMMSLSTRRPTSHLSQKLSKTSLPSARRQSIPTSSATVSSEQLDVGCRVFVPSLFIIGTIRFIGETHFKPGIWAGIELDVEGAGKNDGSIQGVRYFTCPEHTGLFVLASKATVLPPDMDDLPSKKTTKATNAAPRARRASTLSSEALDDQAHTVHTTVPSTTRICASSKCQPRKSKSSTTVSERSHPKSSAEPDRRGRSKAMSESVTTATTSTTMTTHTRSVVATASVSTKTITTRKTTTPHRSTTTSLHKPTASKSTTTASSVAGSQRSMASSRQPAASKSTTATTTTGSSKSTALSPATPSSRHLTTSKSTVSRSTSNDKTPSVVRLGASKSTVTTTREAKSSQRMTRSKSSASLQSNADAIAELRQMHALLEQSRKEHEELSRQVDGKEAAWSRLVSKKESIEIQLKEKDALIARLEHTIELQQAQLEAERRRIQPSVDEMEQQNQRISRLDRLVQEWQAKAAETTAALHTAEQHHMAQMDQLRRALAERDSATAALERECESLRKASMETIQACDISIRELQQKHNEALAAKHKEYLDLERTMLALRRQELQDPPTPDTDDPRQRLEGQLLLVTRELDLKHDKAKALAAELEHARQQIKQFQLSEAATNAQFAALQQSLENEVREKRTLMDEVTMAQQMRVALEDEHDQLKLANAKMERELADAYRRLSLVESPAGQAERNQHGQDKTLEGIDEQLAQEQQRLKTLHYQLEHENAVMRREKETHYTDITLLDHHSRYADLTRQALALVDHLSTRLVTSEQRLQTTEMMWHSPPTKHNGMDNLCRQSDDRRYSGGFISPLSPVSLASFRMSPHKEEVYCEICEVYGHDVLGCTAFLATEVERGDSPSSSCGNSTPYCVNCDIFGAHPTEDCPNQDEMF